jgi:tRNA threonylcarbamoyladenosine biosynthesis protein TsaE
VKAFAIRSEAAMETFGGAIADAAAGREVRLYLSGDLAAGKTTLTRGFLRRRGHGGAVKSPTFTLVESYDPGGRQVHHFDLYRITDAEELDYIGIEEYFVAQTDCIVEWPERGAGVLPPPDLEIRLVAQGSSRLATVVAVTPAGHKMLEELNNTF